MLIKTIKMIFSDVTLIMTSVNLKGAEAAAKIYFAVSLLSDGMHSILEKSLGFSNRLDFNGSLKLIGEKAGVLFPDQEVQSQLAVILERARKIRNQYSHQVFDANRFEHDVECLLKLASLIGLIECSQEIKKFVGIPSEDWEKLRSEGNKHYKKRKWTEAMNCYTRAIRTNSKVAVLYSNRALCEIQLSKFDLAREDAEDAIELDPQQVKFYRILSEALFNLRLYQLALGACSDGMKIDSRDEILLERMQSCKALALAEGESHVTEDGEIEPIRNSEAFTELWKRKKCATDVSPDDVCPMDSIKLQTIHEVDEAHQILRSGRGNIREEQRAFDIFESAAKRGCAEGLYNMAIMYKDGKAGLARDPGKYLELCQKAAEQKPYISAMDDVLFNTGVAEAENAIGMAYRDGLAVNPDEKLAFQWFLKSAQHDCVSAMTNLGSALYKGAGCERNLESARWWFEKSAHVGQSEAQFKLARMLIDGEGGPVDVAKAAELLKAAADQGLPGALEALQQHMRSGVMSVKSMDAAKRIIQEVAATNDKEALFLIGMNYIKGEGGFKENIVKAEKYLKKASNQKHQQATFVLGNLLLQMRRNEDAAIYLRKAAEDGNTDAQWTLGCLLCLGHGVEPDASEGRRWLHRSNKEDTTGSIDDVIETSAEILRFEAAVSFSKDGLTMQERLQRYFECFASNPVLKQVHKDIFNLFKLFEQQQNSLHPSGSIHTFRLMTSGQKMAERVQQGSKIAQKYFDALDILDRMRLALESKNCSDAFLLYRQADRIWQPINIDVFTWKKLFDAAAKAFEKNPKDADAFFVIINFRSVGRLATVSELLHMSLKCTNLNPNVAEFYYLLGNMYGFNGDGVGAQRAFERALELNWEPSWLYGKASALRHQKLSDRRKVIEAYKEFIDANDPDHRHIPEACYCIAEEYLRMENERMAREYFQKGLRAESPEVRLPCFEPVVDCPPKSLLQNLFMLADMKLSAAKSSTSAKARCEACGKHNAPQRCSKCKKAYYCNRDCQQNNWKQHKKHCLI